MFNDCRYCGANSGNVPGVRVSLEMPIKGKTKQVGVKMQHINLIDYIDRPESIRHVIDSFPDVVKIEYLPENLKMNKMKV